MHKVCRRELISALAGGTGCACLSGCFSILKRAPCRPDPSERINVGIIGCGIMGWTNAEGFLADRRVQITVVCDPVVEGPGYGYAGKQRMGCGVLRDFVDRRTATRSCRLTTDWREVVDDPTVDAVVVTTPDHWHALIAVAAMRAGKHVFCQKPMTLGVSEGREMVRIARETGVVFQVGSQHRHDRSYRQAGELVAGGWLGKILSAEVGLPGSNGGKWGHGRDTAPRSYPDYFNADTWRMWLGPSRHWPDDAFIPAIHEPMCWRWNSRTGGGMITDWGSHWLDIVQRTLGTERTGPVAVENMRTNLSDDPYLNWADHYSFDIVYASGVRVRVSDSARNGITWHCEKGDLFVNWSVQERPDFLKRWDEDRDLRPGDVRFYRARDGHGHESDFIDGIYERRPIATDCEIGHRSVSICHIANICERLRLDRLDWDPVAESFVGKNAVAANCLLDVPYLNGWSL